jgi:hypothetical protein
VKKVHVFLKVGVLDVIDLDAAEPRSSLAPYPGRGSG